MTTKLADIEILLKDLRIGVKEKFEYRMVSPVTIIRNHSGPLNLGDKPIVGERQSRAARRIANQRIIEEYLSKAGMDGWELVTDLSYEGLPYNGALVFKKKYYIEDEKPEETSANADYRENLNKGNNYQRFEQETGKHAVWQGKETKAYREWLENKNTAKTKSKEET